MVSVHVIHMPSAGNLGNPIHVYVYDYYVLFFLFVSQIHYLIECIDLNSRLASACNVIIYELLCYPLALCE